MPLSSLIRHTLRTDTMRLSCQMLVQTHTAGIYDYLVHHVKWL